MPDKSRNKINELKDDKELELDGKNQDHIRKQELHDAFNTVSKAAIYIIPCLVLFFVLILSYHYISTDNWAAFIGIGQTIAQLIGGYVVRYLQELGIKSNLKN